MKKSENIKALIKQLAECVAYLHKKDIAHNDIKLDNFYAYGHDFENQKFDIKIADFEYSH